ncbi:hypothetical protein HMPREF1008_01615 [Olsenella sp. oral taxon 809 str. F0356]|uniref:YhgE/Pip domain-containing protein n=1 Tax=Olsenella sp. oral taxon 809 TaxID=661086 RepID=UPI000231F357|nr:YhgE/Pip domain-containing protein [Olsenella sp. oral taxon 809]EHF01470.1 hypothetical protein HMPREF1008_01615 [Olsenella sp. oral taxon 809 str. F0356]
MSRVLEVARRDFLALRHNVIALVVCVGLVVVPSFYAWFNIAGAWDPYGSTGNLKVALANSDEGYKGELVPVELNVGDRVVARLRQSDKVGYVVCDEDQALEGVRSGEYYAAIVIPRDFSRKILGILSPGATKAQVSYYSNDKKNAIGKIVTGKVSTSVQEEIDSSFADAVTQVGASVLQDLGSYLDDDQTTRLASSFEGLLARSSQSLRQASGTLQSYQAVVDSLQGLMGSADALLAGTQGDGGTLAQSLSQAAGGVRGLGGGLEDAGTTVSSSLQRGASSLDGVSSALDSAYKTLDGQGSDLSDGLAKAKAEVDQRRADLQALSDDLDGSDTLSAQLEDSLGDDAARLQDVRQLRLTIQGLNRRVSSALDDLGQLSDALQEAIDDVDGSRRDATGSKAELEGLVADAKDQLSSGLSTWQGELGQSLGSLADDMEEAAGKADSVSSQASSAIQGAQGKVADATSGLDGMGQTLREARARLDSAADRMDATRASLDEALASADVDRVRAVLSGDPADLADFVSSPVSLQRDAVFPVQNNGSAMAPFYTTLAIWVGAVILCALVRTGLSPEVLRRTGARPRHAYLGRLAFFAVVGLAQTTLVLLGDLFFLRIQCLHPWLFLLAGWLASLVFVNLTFALTASFGDVGKAIAVFLMVIQVAGSGGTFPREMLPSGFFQAAYPFLPFVHAEKAMRCAIAGLWGADYWLALARLLAFLPPTLLLGLLLRKPVARLTSWMERSLESTRLM